MHKYDTIALVLLGGIGLAAMFVEIPASNKETLAVIVGALAGILTNTAIRSDQ